jgi:hypothetical protein
VPQDQHFLHLSHETCKSLTAWLLIPIAYSHLVLYIKSWKKTAAKAPLQEITFAFAPTWERPTVCSVGSRWLVP